MLATYGEHGNTDSGRRVKALDSSSGVTQPFNGKPVENYERNWDAFSGSMWNIEWNIGWGRWRVGFDSHLSEIFSLT